MTYYYNINAQGEEPTVVDKNWVAYYGGIDPDQSTPEELAEQGFYLFHYGDVPSFNPNIYTLVAVIDLVGTDAYQVFSLDPLPLPDSKKSYTDAVDSKAYSLLQPTDWVVVRQAETGVEAPENVTSWRESVRLEAQTKRDAIGNCDNPEELDDYVNSPEYFEWPAPV